MRRFILVAAFAAACGQSTSPTAQLDRRALTAAAYRVRDVPAPMGGALDGELPRSSVRLGDRLFLSVTTPQEGRELWVTDGTTAGTRLVIDLVPGPSSSSPHHLVRYRDGVAFSAGLNGFGRQVWFSDGTTAGTRLLSDVNPARGDPTELTPVGDTVFFAADADQTGLELWKTDGTENGTVLVKDIEPGQFDSWPDHLTNVNGTLFFSAGKIGIGNELWKSDGTAEGTVLVKDLFVGVDGSRPSQLYAWNGVLYFAAEVGGGSTRLFRSDGTEGGTFQIGTGSSPAFPTKFTAAGDKLFFHAATETAVTGGLTYGLWVTDGTAEGTKVPRAVGTGNPAADNFTPFNGFLYFIPRGADAQQGLWRSDGTESGTVWVSEADDRVTAFDRGLVFGKNVQGAGEEPHFSNGTPGAPIVMLGNLVIDGDGPGMGSMNEAAMLPLSDKVVFFPMSEFGVEPWVTDGTATGTRLLLQLSRARDSSDPKHLLTHGGSLYFVAGAGRELWVSDGSAAGTQPVRSTTGDAMVNTVGVGVAGTTLLTGSAAGAPASAAGTELYKVAGAQSELLLDLSVGSHSASPRNFFTRGTSAYFHAQTGTNGAGEPWITDGTQGGTVRLYAMTSNGNVANFVAAESFVGIDMTHGLLLTTDGTPGGTAEVMRSATQVAYLTGVGDRLFFAGSNSNGSELYVANRSSVQLVQDINGYPSGASPRDIVAFQGQALYGAMHPTLGVELWKSDGTDAGTVVLDLRPGIPGSSPSRLVVHDGWVYFRGFSPEHGYELWRTDGTVENSQQVIDLAPGRFSGLVDAPMLSIPGGPLLFVGSDITHGAELWQTQGTAETTTLVADVAPGLRSASPSLLTRVGNELFFSASDDSGDRELWATGVNPNPESPDGGTGGGSSTDGGTSGDGDGDGQPDAGCGCGATPGIPSLIALALGLALAVRRRPARR